jgi:hypothetical protein
LPANQPRIVLTPFARESTPIEETAYSDEEDLLDRWVSVAVLGGLAVASSLLVLVPGLQGGGVPSGISLVAIGGLELFFGAFLVYVVYPPVLWAAALGSGLTAVEGAFLMATGGAAAWLICFVYLLAGGSLATAGTLYAFRTWRIFSRDA